MDDPVLSFLVTGLVVSLVVAVVARLLSLLIFWLACRFLLER